MRQAEVDKARSLVQDLLSSNLKQGIDGNSLVKYSYLCGSPKGSPWQNYSFSCFQAIAMARIEPEQSKNELLSLLAGQDEDGFIGQLHYWGIRAYGFRHILSYVRAAPGRRLRRSSLIHPPLLAQSIAKVATLAEDPAFILTLLPSLDSYHQWLATNRADQSDGLLVIVSPHESGMPSLPGLDRRQGNAGRPSKFRGAIRNSWIDTNNWMRSYDSSKMLKAGTFWLKDATMNACYADSLSTMSSLHRSVGNTEVAAAYQVRAETITTVMLKKMLDLSRGAFFNLYGEEERRSGPLTIGGLIPLLMQGLPQAVAATIVEQNIHNPKHFWLKYPLPSVSASETSFNPRDSQNIWRGPTSVTSNWLVWLGLIRHGYTDIAEQLASRTLNMVTEHGMREAYNPLSGTGLGSESFAPAAIVLDMAS